MKKLISLSFILVFAIVAKAQTSLPKVVSGKIERIEHFKSKFITSRNIDIWLPKGYSDSKEYPVLYMHDGQMLYDPEKTWNKQAWQVDDVASSLFVSDRVKKFIVVGIWNGAKTRHPDYFPQKPFGSLNKIEKDTVTAQLKSVSIETGEVFSPESDHYLKFLVEELKPYIDKEYSVYTNKENTFIMGSSMGGLISMYALCEYPKVFGGAACLSTHWVGTFTFENNPMPNAFIEYLKANLPEPNQHKIYFDCGNQTLDALYPAIQMKIDQMLLERGFKKDNWITRYFPGENHSEEAWNKRLHIPLEFLFKE